MSVSLEVIPTGTVGAEVKGVDLAAVTGAHVEAIKRAWYMHDVLIFRKQTLTDDDLLAFSSIRRRTRARGASRLRVILTST